MKKKTKLFIFSTLPFVILMLTCILSINIMELSNESIQIFMVLAYVVAGISILFSIWFHHSRVFFCTLLLVACQISLTIALQSPTRVFNRLDILIYWISILLPISIAIFTFLKERGITTVWGLLKAFLILSQILLVYIDLKNESSAVSKIDFYATQNNNHINAIAIPTISIVIIVGTIILLLLKYMIDKSYIDITMVAVLLTLFIILSIFNTGRIDRINLLFCSIYTILALAVAEASYSMAFLDQLTEIPSRRALDQEMMKLGRSYSIAMLDVDHFKKFNDTYGHDVGDQVLRMIASVISEVGGRGKAFRYGGEEFAIIFSGKTTKEAFLFLEELRVKVEKRAIIIRGKERTTKKPKNKLSANRGNKRVRVTISIGVAQRNERYRTPGEVVKQADLALYKAKKNGRNCTKGAI